MSEIFHCQTCFSKLYLQRSHFVKTKHVHISKKKDYDYESQDNWFTQCQDCHQEYEKLNTKKKFNFGNKTRQEYLIEKGLPEYAARVEYLINE